MKKLVCVVLLTFSCSLFSMEKEIAVEDVPLNQKNYGLLVYHIATMVVIHKSCADLSKHNGQLSLYQKTLEFPMRMNKYVPHLYGYYFEFDEYSEFVEENGSSDIENVYRSLEEDATIDTALAAFSEKSFEMYDLFSRVAIDHNALADAVEKILSKEQTNYFNDNFQELSDAPKLWMASRITLLEWMRQWNKKSSFKENCVKFGDSTCAYGSGICTGGSLALCATGNVLWGSVVGLTGLFSWLNFNSYCIPNLSVHCEAYWQSKKETRDLKLLDAIDSLALYNARTNHF